MVYSIIFHVLYVLRREHIYNNTHIKHEYNTGDNTYMNIICFMCDAIIVCIIIILLSVL